MLISFLVGLEISALGMLLKLPQVMEITTLSRSTIYSWISAGSFPAPIKLGPRCVAWLKEEIDSWLTERIATTRFDSGDAHTKFRTRRER